MHWHCEGQKKDGDLRYSDSTTYQNLHEAYLSFEAKIQNIRLRLAADGFNRISNTVIVHSP